MNNNLALYESSLELFRKELINEFQKSIENPIFSHIEKKLLRARLLLREKKWDEVIHSLEKTTISSSFLAAEGQALISFCYSMKGEWQEAIVHNDLAISSYLDLNLSKQLYNCYYNSSVYFSRLGLIILSNYYLTMAKNHSFSNVDKMSINLGLAANYSKLSNYSMALKILESDLEKLDTIDEFDFVVTYRLVSSDIYYRSGNFTKSLMILEKLISIKKAPFRGRILFDHALLSAHLKEDYSIIKWPEAVLKDDIYRLKAKVIDYLLTGQIQEAQKAWIKLANKEPSNYLPNFEMKYKSDENALFFVFIKKIKSIKKESENTKLNAHLSGRLKILFDLLYQNKFPISKEELIEKIWSTSYDPKYDARFYKLIQRLKEIEHCKIINNHGGYLLK